MTKLSTIRVLAAAIATATILFAVATEGAHAASRGNVAHVTGSTSAGPSLRNWPRRPPCRNWHKICYPF